METLTTNLIGTGSKRVKVNGRDYLVAPVTLLVPGVLAGSKGPLHYPEEEVANSVDWWNGVPITLNHPTLDGQPVTARRPDVLERSKLGRVYNVRFDGKLRAEGWFDAEATRRVDPRLWEALERGARVEVSTGLYTRNDPAPEGSNHNGTPYTHVARNYRPDHLAVLPDSVGACSVQQGCGVHNQNTDTQDTTESIPSVKEPSMSFDRSASISFLTANCECWKAPEDKAILDGMTDAALSKLEQNAKKPSPGPAATHVPPPVANTAAPAVVTPQPTVAQMIANAVTPVAPVVKELTMEEFRRLMPAEAKAVWNSAEEIVDRERATLIGRITVNVTDQAQKVQLATSLSTEPLPKLRLLAAAVPAPLPTANYALHSAPGYAPVANDNFDENDVLGLPTINWAEEAKANSQRQVG